MSLKISPYPAIKLLMAIFIIGGLLLLLIVAIFPIKHAFMLIGLYTWSSSLFLFYKTQRLTKRLKKNNGAIQKQ